MEELSETVEVKDMEEEVNEVEAGENFNNNCEKEESSVVDTKEVNAQVHSSTATNCNKKGKQNSRPPTPPPNLTKAPPLGNKPPLNFLSQRFYKGPRT